MGVVNSLKQAILTGYTRAPLKDVHRVAKLAADNVVSIGSSLSHVHVPGRKVTEAGEDEVAFNEVEIGMGMQEKSSPIFCGADQSMQVFTTKPAPNEPRPIYRTLSSKCWHTCLTKKTRNAHSSKCLARTKLWY